MRMHDIFCIDLKEKKDIPQNDYFQTGWSWFICSMNLCTACKKWKLATLKLLFLETEVFRVSQFLKANVYLVFGGQDVH